MVISIIVVLVALIGGVGIAVLRKQKASVTENVLATLDRALDEYIQNAGAPPPYSPLDYEKYPGESHTGSSYFPTYLGATHVRRPDACVFLRQAMGTGQVQPIIAGLGERFLVLTVTDPNGTPAQKDTTPSVVDAWAKGDWAKPWDIYQEQVIYYVHPDNALAQDLFGRCVNRRPYFFSAGPDQRYGLTKEGDPSGSGVSVAEAEEAIADNVYSYPVGAFKKNMSSSDR